jgi:hypothetical protein
MMFLSLDMLTGRLPSKQGLADAVLGDGDLPPSKSTGWQIALRLRS